MSIDIDQRLRSLAAEPDPPALMSIEDAVLARVRAEGRRARAGGLRMGALAGLGALILGYAAAMPEEGRAAPTLSPFGPDNPLAPSTLLAADR